MTSAPQPPTPTPPTSPQQPSRTAPIPWVWMGLTALLYAAAGVIMASFPAPYWIWNVALGGAIAQCLALAGPFSLRRFRWWSANVLALVAILGTGAIAMAVAAALGYSGTDNLDALVPKETAFEVVRGGLIALVIAALGAILSAETGDRLLKGFKRLPTTIILAAICILGLGLGGLIGVLVVA